MYIDIRSAPFDPWEEISRYQADLEHAGSFGATACFIGTMRDFNEGESVQSMYLEHYPGMTERHLREIADAAFGRWSILDCVIIHRTGEIEVGEPIVAVAVWAAHRRDALDAAGFIIEDLKSRAPFWKKERLESGDRWVERNTAGYGKKAAGDGG